MSILRLSKQIINRNVIFSRFMTYNIQLNGNNAIEKLGSSFSSLLMPGDNVLLYGYNILINI